MPIYISLNFRAPTWLVDDARICYAFRTEVLDFIVEGLNGPCPLADGVTDDCVEYIRRCGDISKPTERGLHWYDIDGTDRQNKDVRAPSCCTLDVVIL